MLLLLLPTPAPAPAVAADDAFGAGPATTDGLMVNGSVDFDADASAFFPGPFMEAGFHTLVSPLYGLGMLMNAQT